MATKKVSLLTTVTSVSSGDSILVLTEGTTKRVQLSSLKTFINSGDPSLSGSNTWDSVYTTVKSTSGNWLNTYTTVQSTSGTWQGTYSTVQSISGVYTTVQTASASWNEVYTTVQTNSANWGTTNTQSSAVLTQQTEGGVWSGTIDVTKTIAKLHSKDEGVVYTLPDGVEGQILYLVPATTYTRPAEDSDTYKTYLSIANARYVWANGAMTEGSVSYWVPFYTNLGSLGNSNFATAVETLIFTDGKWNLPHSTND